MTGVSPPVPGSYDMIIKGRLLGGRGKERAMGVNMIKLHYICMKKPE
jgi:hypothetical protein